jgi:uncharacterized protein (DUF427 family)
MTAGSSLRRARRSERSRPATRLATTFPRRALPPECCAENGSSFCEWKGYAIYWDVVLGEVVLPHVGWSYPSPTESVAMLRDHVAFYAGPFARCAVDGKTVIPQAGAFTAAGSPASLLVRSRVDREPGAGEQMREDPAAAAV